MTPYLSTLLTALLALASFSTHAASTPSYAMEIVASVPKGSAANAVAKDKTLPSATPFTPCTADAVDAITFTLTYNAGKSATDETSPTKDVYLFLYNPSARGAVADQEAEEAETSCTDMFENEVPCDPKVYAVVRTTYNFNSISLIPLAEVSDILATDHIYLSAWENLGGTIEDVLLRSYLSFDGMRTGIWSLVGIVADADDETLDFGDPASWLAWDVETLVLGAPWTWTRDVTEGDTTLDPTACTK